MAGSWGSDQAFWANAKTVAAAGTAEALDTIGSRFTAIVIKAKVSNTGAIFVGGSDVASTTNDGLDPGETLAFETGSRSAAFVLTDIYIDSEISADGVDFWAVK